MPLRQSTRKSNVRTRALRAASRAAGSPSVKARADISLISRPPMLCCVFSIQSQSRVAAVSTTSMKKACTAAGSTGRAKERRITPALPASSRHTALGIRRLLQSNTAAAPQATAAAIQSQSIIWLFGTAVQAYPVWLCST